MSSNINDEYKKILDELELSDEIEEFSIVDTNNEEIEFESGIKNADKYDYILSISSGVLTGLLDIFSRKEFSIVDAQSWGEEKVNNFVIQVARYNGYEGDDLKKAIKKLEDAFPIPADKVTPEMGGGLQHHLRDFTHHASIVGLIFSILTQFTGKAYGTDTEGHFQKVVVPTEMLGVNIKEKLYNGVVVWFFHLVSDMAGSNGRPGKGTGIPGFLVSFLKEISCLEIFQDIRVKYKDDEIGLSVLAAKLFNGTFWGIEKGDDRVKFDLRTELGVAHEAFEQAIPIVINECIVRGFYAIRHLVDEIKIKDIKTISDLKKIEAKNFLPSDNREISRMTLVSSGVFTLTNLGGACLKSISKENNEERAKEFFLSINYLGVCRFVVACTSEIKYTAEDIKKCCADRKKKKEMFIDKMKSYEQLSLDDDATKILYTLEYMKILKDADGFVFGKLKNKWLGEWIKSGDKDKYILYKNLEIDEAYAFNELKAYAKSDEGTFYKILIELVKFRPYHTLDDKTASSYKFLKYNIEYEKKYLLKGKGVVDAYDLKLLRRVYEPEYVARIAINWGKWIGRIAIIGFVIKFILDFINLKPEESNEENDEENEN